MPIGVQGDLIYKDKAMILEGMITALKSRIPDARIDIDSLFRIFFEVAANEFDGQFLATQLLFNDIWPMDADSVALLRFGDEFGYPIEDGTRSEGVVRVEGQGGTFVSAGARFAASTGPGEIFAFLTTQSGTIPDPGIPDAPDATDAAVAGNITGTIEYAISFLTLEGETLHGAASQPVTAVATKIDVTLPLGGPGTTGRKLYRMENGGEFAFVATMADNSTVTYLDNIATGSLGGLPATVNTAERISLTAEAAEVGLRFNVAPQTIVELAQVPDGVTAVTNLLAFQGGTDPQGIEDYRQKLLEFIRDPQSGSPRDLKAWAEQVIGVQDATVFVNDNLGTPTNGHNTIRISGPDGIIPDTEVIDAVNLKFLQENLANITNHVTTFDPNIINVSVTLTLTSGSTLADVTASVQEAIANYINEISVNKTVYKSGIVDAVFGLPGIVDVVVTVPASNVTSTITEKPISGVITVT